MTKLQGQQQELSDAYRDYEKGMNVHARFKVSNSETGEDMVQDTFMKTWRYLLRGGKIDIMKAFLYHILNNLIVDEYRKRKHATSSLDALLATGFEPPSDPTQKLLNAMDGKIALLLIQDLPEKYQTVIRMRYLQSLTLEEIALLTKQSKNLVAVQLHRGLRHLRTLYKTG
jgi:RNA polymerase sigma factor (sigma-70 family)